MLPTLVVGWRASVLRREEAGRFCKVAGVPLLLRAVCICSKQFNNREASGLNKLAIDQEKFSSSEDAGFVLAQPFYHGDLEPDCVRASTRGLMRGMKIPPQDLALKMHGGAYARGGAYLWDATVLV